MQRLSDHPPREAEFPGRYFLDEARFSGGRDRIRNKEEQPHEPKSPLS